jgi:diaminopimelate epimerase
MGAPILEPDRIPFKAGNSTSPLVGYPLRTEQGILPVTITSMWNPHCTAFVADFGDVNWMSLGREIERHELFPKRTNVEFVKVVSRKEIEARFWERGAGETRSSGTGSCSAVVACILNNLADRKVRVRTPAGILEVEWPEEGGVFLTGPAERIARGTLDCRR